MLQTLPDFLSTYWIYIAGVVVLAGVASYFSEKLRDYVKKALIIFGVVFGLAAGYELVTGDNIIRLPGSVDTKLSADPTHVETGRRYYKSYEERFGEAPPEDK